MPKKPRRDNTIKRAPRTVQSAATVLRRVLERADPGISSENQLTKQVYAGLPASLRDHVLQVIEKPKELVILTSSAAWAARIRLALAEDSCLAGDRRVIVKVAPRGASRP